MLQGNWKLIQAGCGSAHLKSHPLRLGEFGELEANLGYIVTPYFKKNKQANSNNKKEERVTKGRKGDEEEEEYWVNRIINIPSQK